METLSDNWTGLGTRLRAFVGRSRVNDPHAADDIVQDVLLWTPCPRRN
jgi:DNA-directed RNA polymerase specialized sigma24 family protein